MAMNCLNISCRFKNEQHTCSKVWWLSRNSLSCTPLITNPVYLFLWLLFLLVYTRACYETRLMKYATSPAVYTLPKLLMHFQPATSHNTSRITVTSAYCVTG